MEEVFLVFWQIVWPLLMAMGVIFASHHWRADPPPDQITRHILHFGAFFVAVFCLTWALPNIAVRAFGKLHPDSGTVIVAIAIAITIVLMSLKIPYQTREK